MKALTLFKESIGTELRVHPLSKRSLSKNWEDVEILALCDDSRKVSQGSAFFALRGSSFDGHDHLAEVIRRKPAVICVEDISRVPSEFEGVIFEAENTRKIFSKACYRFFGSPADHWLNIGVTGTNGKTTVTHMIEHIFTEAKFSVGVIGTVDHHFGNKVWTTQLTTPGTLILNQRLSEFAGLGVNVLSMEVSSHALSQFRADGVPFNIGVFTNLTRDHLDFHLDMEDYYTSKARLFKELILTSRNPKGAVINVDDEFGKRLSSELKLSVLTFGRSGDLSFEISKEDFSGLECRVKYQDRDHHLRLSIPCRHNLQNAMAAVGAALLSGIEIDVALYAISRFTGVKGRLEVVTNRNGIHAFVDYAHTDDALKSVLFSLKSIRDKMLNRPKIITVFGCGGDRDKGKRPLMYEAASTFSDVLVVTSDNPRTEDADAIIDDILVNSKKDEIGKKVFREVDRKKGIQLALKKATKGDVVLVAGKGHEDYQILGTQKVHFSDREVIEETLRNFHDAFQS